MADFDGFPKATLTFLRQLKKNNNREWFQENKQRYEDHWLAPSLAFIEAMQKPLDRFSPCFLATPKKTGGSLMRIYRDTRFAKEKTPYKTNIGIHFRHEMGRDVHAPGLYVHIEPKEVFLGVGVWHPDSQSVKKIREHIDRESTAWKRAAHGKAFQSHFSLAGDSLKRPPKDFDDEHEWIEDLKRKDFIGLREVPTAAIHEADFPQQVSAAFMKAKSFMAFLCDAVGVPF